MTTWRVDFKVKSDLVLDKGQKEVVFKAPDGSHSIHLMTRRGEGKHAADELYLSAHVVLDGAEARQAADAARTVLRRFLDVLAVVTSASYRITERVLVVDWTPGLTERGFLYFKPFPNPNVPLYGLAQEHMESVATLSGNPIPGTIRLAIRWWADGVSASPSSAQFQRFWYALEILAEHVKPTAKVASKCPVCSGDLHCAACGEVPLHRPYPKQAIAMLIEKHVKGQSGEFFSRIDEIRNRLLHGDDPVEIERALNMKWEEVTDALGKATWAALLSNLISTTAAHAVAPGKLALAEIARSCRCSNSPMAIPRHRSAARMTAAYISFSTGRSPNAFGTAHTPGAAAAAPGLNEEAHEATAEAHDPCFGRILRTRRSRPIGGRLEDAGKDARRDKRRRQRGILHAL